MDFETPKRRLCPAKAVPGAALLAALLLAACAAVQPRGGTGTADEAGFAPTGARPPASAARHMVASANPIASEVGRDVLRKGGNAVDAALAMQMVLTLVEPQSSGIGGGGFLMHYDGGSGEITAFEGREAAPRAVTETLFLGPDGKPKPRSEIRAGGISVAVPGMLRLLETAHGRYGRLPWRDLLDPAIRLAEAGFEVSPRLSRSIARDRFLPEYDAARSYFFDSRGQPLAPGSRLTNPALAETLKAVARRGADAFYRGPVARDIARAVSGDSRRPGSLSEADLAAYRVKSRPPICGPYRAHLVCGFGPPTAGGVTTLMTLAMLERFDLSRLAPGSAEAVHLISEASRLANADRLRYVADPDFVTVPLRGMLDRGYLETRSDLIRRDRAMDKVSPGNIPMLAEAPGPPGMADDFESPSTTHFSVVDSQGDAVAMTSSVGGAFGSRLMVRGFMLNNHATDFSAVPRAASGRPKVNRPGPGKRPRSSQSPTFVFNGGGRLTLAVGSPGGTRIIPYVVKTVIAVLDWGLDVQAAISLPNHAARRGRIELERGTALEDIAPALEALGHRVRIRDMASGIQGIRIRDGRLTGGADPRREGVALGD